MYTTTTLKVVAFVCAFAQVSATVSSTHAPTHAPSVAPTGPTMAPTAAPTNPTSTPTSTPTALQAWTYGETSSGDTCTGITTDPCGTAYWGEIAGYELCSTGENQSPINIVSAEPDYELRMPEFHVEHDGCDEWVQKSLAGTFEVTVHDDQMSEACHYLNLEYDGKEYDFYQIHFHTPSEHSVGGGYYEGEAQLVHKSADGDILILGIFLEVSAVDDLHPYNNSFLDRIWSLGGGDLAAGETTHLEHQAHPLNPYDEFMPGNPAHYRYNGSLTTPPCNEGVEWLIFTTPVKISSDDYAIMQKAIGAHPNFVGTDHGSSHRYPAQDLHDRHVTLYTDATEEFESRLATEEADIESTETLSFGALILAALSMIVTFVALTIICSLKSTLDLATARQIPSDVKVK